MAMECVRSIAGYAAGPIWSELGYIIFYRSNLDNLNAQLQTLKEANGTLQERVDAAEQNGKKIFDNVQKCLAKAGDTITKANNFLENEEHARVGCLDGPFPNLWTRHQLSKKATEMAKEISDTIIKQLKESIQMPEISDIIPRFPVGIPPSARGYKGLDSRASILSDIMHALKDPNIYKIGLHGMGGVGKSTLVKELAWKVEQDALFDKVLVATVTISPDVKNIQDQLAGRLGLIFQQQETEDLRASRLCDRMKKVNSILVILDNIWKKVDLTEIGIPYGDDHKGCKLLMTSRNIDLLRSDMDTDKEFKLELLTKNESWILFQKTAGNVVEDYNINPIALKVAHSCAGLPLSIVTVATALKKKNDLSIWRDALNKLTTFDHERMKLEVYPAIELSYDHLESEELKSFFRFIASLANGMFIKDLLIIAWGLGLFKNVNTLGDARNRVHKLIADLRASCLLLEGRRDWIKMHDVVHEVVSSIAFKVQPFFSMPRFADLIEWPKKDILQKCHSIFLAWCYFHELPGSLNCPELKFLCLKSRDNFWKVPDDFFVETRELQVLDFGGFNCCPSPPSSLGHLTNLRALYLCQSMLEDITIVAKLMNLEILSLERSKIKELPIELAQLTRLRLLDLSYCSGLTVIPANLLSSLTSLEELYMENCFFQWEAEERKNQSKNACLGELRHLHNLTALYLQVQHASILPRDLLIFGKLERYKISIGYGWKRSSSGVRFYETSRTLMLNSGTTTNIHLDCGVKLLLERVEELYLAKLKGVRNVLYQLNREGFPQLKLLDIQDNDEIEYIIDSTNSSCALPNMESLVLHNLTNMTNIIHGLLPVQFFTKLEVIKVKGCHRLENLFLHSIVRNLSQLVKVDISQCNSITGIIVDQGKDDINEIEELKFPKLSSLTLDCLPMLVSFSCKPLLDDSNIPLTIFDEKIQFPALESLKISSINTKNIWAGQLSTHSWIQNLKNLTIDSCGKLEYLFPSSVTTELVNLQHLEIIRCGMLKEIFEPEERMDNFPYSTKALSSKEATFPSLETLIISHMDSLKSIWNNQVTPNSFCKLVNMEISFCKMLSNIFPCYALNNLHNMKKLLVTDCGALEVVFEIQGQNTRDAASQDILATQLKTLTLKRLPMLKHIWSTDPHGSINFQNLCTVEVIKCESLNHVFPLNVTMQLLKLQVLKIRDCGVENIVAKDETVATVPGFIFSQLTLLRLSRLHKLESWYPGIHSLDCPKLWKLDVYHCDKLQVFTLESQNSQEEVPLGRQPLFLFDKVLNIEELSLSSENVTAICNGDVDFHTIGQFSSRSLQLQCFHDESDQVPWAFLESFTNLENLFLNCSSFIQIFPSEAIETVIKLRNLKLKGLLNLEYLCQENTQIQPILQNLEELTVIDCDGLKNIVPSSVLFENLDTLTVEKYSGLTNITMLSTARSFTQIKKLSIHDCDMIEEIVTGEEGDTGEVTFPKLERLQLIRLPKLKCFCSGNQSFKFPLLKVMFVIECSMMETFSHASLSTPSLRAVHVTKEGYVWRWEGDVNATVEKLFNEMNLKISSSNTSNIWAGQLSTRSCFQILKSLTIDDCGKLEYLFPSSVTRELVNLQHLEIIRCGMLKEIFESEERMDNFPYSTKALSSKEATFPSLETLIISHMDSLKSIWNNQVTPNSFCKLVNMEISFCKMLSNIFPCYALNNLHNMKKLLVTDCGALEVVFEIQGQNTRDAASQDILATQLKTLTLERLPMLKHIWSMDPHGSINFRNLCTVEVIKCESLNHVFPLNVTMQLLKLQVLKIRDCGVENIIAKDEIEASVPRFVFPKLILLILSRLHKLQSWYPGIHSLDCPKLWKLDVYHCDKLQVFTLESQNSQVEVPLSRQPLFLFDKVLNIEELSLSSENVTAICNGDVDFHTIGQFSSRSLQLRCFHDESDQVPWAFLESFTNLENLFLNCSSFIQIFPSEAIETVIKLRNLKLKGLLNLEYLCQENTQIQPILQNLEKLTVINCHGLKNIVPSSVLFGNLDTLAVVKCSGLTNMTMLSTARSFTQLKKLSIHDCKMIEEIVTGEEGDTGEVTFPKLERLQLIRLPKLKCFCSGNQGFKFPLLKVMFVIECPMMETFSHASLSTPSLRAVCVTEEGDVWHWEGDVNATVEKLFNEMNLKISSSNTSNIWAGQLSTRSCFQILKSLTIDDCGKLEYLFPSSVTTELVNLQHLEIIRCGMLKEIFESEERMDNFPYSTKALSSKEATFPSLETLIISHMDNLKSIWNNQVTPNSFCKLVKMKISFCKMLSNIFPCYALNNLHNMKKLLVTDCGALEVVFEIQGQNTRDAASQDILATQLKTLTLKRLPMLKHIWSTDPHGSINFRNLCTVEVIKCESLNHVFPLNVTMQLLKLQVLKIRDCGVENIVAKDETVATVAGFIFSQLTLLRLSRLHKLESWYPGIHSLDCPKLWKLDVYHCDKLQVFTLESQNSQEEVPLGRQPLFLFDKVLSIEELSLSSENVTAICNGDVDFHTIGQFSSRSLQLRCFHDESDQVPWAFLESFTNLENLFLNCSSFIQIFPSEAIETVIKLRHLKIEYLRKLECLCQENTQIQPILQNLEELTLIDCDGLKNIVPSSVLFENLDTLTVEKCSGLTNITMLSTARSFTQLKKLSIHDCDMIEEIVTGEEGDTGEVTFPKLERLQLIRLPKLKCFCSGNQSFKFPLLKVMFVIECSMMETFSHASLSTPSLRAVHLTEKGDVWRWEGDVNATISDMGFSLLHG